MPLIENSDFRPAAFLQNGHLQTIVPSLLRKVDDVIYHRERISTPDDDFLDLDWSRVGSQKVAIISHGLEGNTSRAYVKGMVRQLNQAGWDALAWNFRGCSGEPNRRLRSYHSGATGDLETVIQHVLATGKYSQIALVGFSMGGNIILKYLGERGDQIPSQLCRAVTISVPCHLSSSADRISQGLSKIYLWRFLRMLRKKIQSKMDLFPSQIDDHNFHRISSFREFDDRYTAPIHGFADAEDYYRKCSSLYFLEKITIPTLLINAANDPFLSDQCFPVDIARRHKLLTLEIPASGGHVGFVPRGNSAACWSELRAAEFLNA